MRLSDSQIRQGLLHPEQMVRDAALHYFSQSFSPDPAVMPLARQAIETHGWQNAFLFSSGLADLAQSEETLLWLIDQLNRLGRPKAHEDAERCDCLSSMIAGADTSLLMKHEQRLLGLEGLYNEHRTAIAERLRLMAIDTDSLWQELEQFCEDGKDKQYIKDVNLDQAFRLAEAVARDESSARRVLDILAQTQESYENNPMGWMDPLAARIAGEMRLEAAVPLLVKKLAEDGGDLMNEACARAFVKIGSEAVVEAIATAFPQAPWHFKLYSSSSLGDIHCQPAAPAALGLLAREESADIRANLILAVLSSFDSEGIAPARELTQRGNREVRRSLVAASILMGQTFPELERWTEEQRKQDETMRRRMEDWAVTPPPPKPKAMASSLDDLLKAPPQPLAAGKKKAGRNDPCPCGSGKKYKKCCMGKD